MNMAGNSNFFNSLFSGATQTRVDIPGADTIEKWKIGSNEFPVTTYYQEDGKYRRYQLPNGQEITASEQPQHNGTSIHTLEIGGEKNGYPAYTLTCQNGKCSFTRQDSYGSKPITISPNDFHQQANMLADIDPASHQMVLAVAGISRETPRQAVPAAPQGKKNLAALEAWHIKTEGNTITVDHATPNGHDIQTYRSPAPLGCTNGNKTIGNMSSTLDDALKNALPKEVLDTIKLSVKNGAHFDIESPCGTGKQSTRMR